MDEVLKALGKGGLTAASAVNPAFAIAGAAAPLFQGVLGLTQGARARAISKQNPRHGYAIPGAATNAMNNQYNLAQGQAPGLTTARNQMAQSQAGSIAAIQNSGGGGAETLSALTRLDQNAGAQAQQLGATQEDWKARQMQNLINQENAYAQWQDKKNEWEIRQPYEQAQAKSAAMNDAANVNIEGALKNAGGLVAQSLGYKGGGKTPTGEPIVNADGSLGPVTPVAAPADNSKEYQSLLGIDDPLKPRDASPVASPAAVTPTLASSPTAPPQINTSGPGEPIPFMGSVEPTDNEMPALSRGLKVGNFDPKVYDQRTGKPLPKNGPNSFAGANPNARISGIPPKFDASKTMDNYDFEAIDRQYNPPAPKGPFPIGYDKKTGITKPVVGPPNYNPIAAEPTGPFPGAGMKANAFDPNGGADQGYDFKEIERLTAKQQSGNITPAEMRTLRKTVAKYSYLLNQKTR